jgi:hypothetical protein
MRGMLGRVGGVPQSKGAIQQPSRVGDKRQGRARSELIYVHRGATSAANVPRHLRGHLTLVGVSVREFRSDCDLFAATERQSHIKALYGECPQVGVEHGPTGERDRLLADPELPQRQRSH